MYTTTRDNLHVCVLNRAHHERTCGYWYTVTSRGMAHTAYARRESLLQWAEDRGLSFAKEVVEADGVVIHFMQVKGSYREAMHMDRAVFDAIVGKEIRVLSNGDYTLGKVSVDADGLRTVHSLNPNVRDRPVFDHTESRRLVG